MSKQNLFLGIDVGSTTVKIAIIDDKDQILFSTYQRHMSDVRKKIIFILKEVQQQFPDTPFKITLTGSGALSLCTNLNLNFVQEVIASSLSIKNRIPKADVIIELGGEDAKLTFLTSGIDLRMNETCAGGTGAFIDQMASFLNMDIGEMDRLALTSKTIYPIASRCGVFAKTDIVPLINEGCAKSDIAMSIMQAVVNQFIGGLSRGRDITGTVVFLGGPLAFIKSLRQCFINTLNLDDEHAILPEKAEIFVALGAALYSKTTDKIYTLSELIKFLTELGEESNIQKLPPLFQNEQEYKEFLERHSKTDIKKFPLEEYEGNAYLGIDSGSTTLKATLIDEENRLLYSYYGSNNGDPFSLAINILKEIYRRKKPGLTIKAAAATGYGSALLKAGLKLDIDEVETVAHCTASTFFAPKATFVLDIGGQDIKCMSLKDGIIQRIGLNEACSAGCGSFIENFAKSLNMDMPSFVKSALTAQNPVDLGTRCTVFMNSKVKQAQKEGAKVGDIAAGLSYSVIKNACYKVIKIHNVEELGDCIVAQGGSFLNDALLRALEIQVGKLVIRPGLSGLMGAFGAALIAKKRGLENGTKTSLINEKQIAELKITTKNIRCQGCTNHCMLTITNFGNKQNFVSGNRCEKGAGLAKNNHINLYKYKYDRLFNYYKPLEKEKAKYGTVGIPRALGIYENFPLWFTLLTELGFRVELSNPSSKKLFFSGYGSIPSQTVCYPAKIAHGHIIDLIKKKVDNIFFPCIPKNQKEFASQADSYNCPIVTSYPELLSKNITELAQSGIPYYSPFLPLDENILAKRLKKIKLFKKFTLKELKTAIKKAFAEQNKFKKDIQQAGLKAIKELKEKGQFGLVLAGHPYHIDPAINHGIPELINACGLAVLTEDSVAHLQSDIGKLWARDQWTFHSRLYHAGSFTEKTDNLAVLQLVSFGCGVDAITSEQLEDIVNAKGRLYAQIKIDEGENLGPAKIRIRSLLAAMRDMKNQKNHTLAPQKTVAKFTPEMKKTHTILIPQMSPIHFQFMEAMFESEGYKVCQLPTVSKEAIELGLKNVNNDVCYPAIVVIGQILQAIKEGKFDTHKIAILVSQTNGGCRASNYAGLLRHALEECNMPYIPVLTLNVSGSVANQTGFSLGYKVLLRGIMVACYGDVLMQMIYRVRPYEKVPGSTKKLEEKWIQRIKNNLRTGNLFTFAVNITKMIREFDKLPLKRIKRKPRVGLVGEILLKFHPDANNQAVSVIEQEGGEAVVPDLMDFMLYGFYDHIFNYRNMKGSWKSFAFSYLSMWGLELFRFPQRLGFWLSKRFHAPIFFKKLRQKAREVISLGHQTGEGWLLTAEIIELLESGVRNVLCMQPFGCLPNHIVGKGFIKEIKKKFPTANIIAVDYDPGASETNQINRIKLMMSIAKQDN